MNPTTRLLSVCLLLAMLTPFAAGQTSPASQPEAKASPFAEIDAAYARILSAAVTRNGLVRYEKLDEKNFAEALAKVVEGYATNPAPKDRDARLAFYMNAYNANVLHKVGVLRRKGGFESVIKVAGFFDRDQIRVGGESMTLNDLENKKVRSFKDERIHAALVCAAISCPPLRAEPFSAKTLDAQLDDQSQRWVNDPDKFKVLPGGPIGLSRIMEWYGQDFMKGGALGYVRRHAKRGSKLHEAASRPTTPTVWLEYDWALNQAP